MNSDSQMPVAGSDEDHATSKSKTLRLELDNLARAAPSSDCKDGHPLGSGKGMLRIGMEAKRR